MHTQKTPSYATTHTVSTTANAVTSGEPNAGVATPNHQQPRSPENYLKPYTPVGTVNYT
jgi:hypothetical protein